MFVLFDNFFIHKIKLILELQNLTIFGKFGVFGSIFVNIFQIYRLINKI